ncbi:hypothetical protein ACRE_080510 [Hapsidospora chrysogenum ATCC 11550]|uniref:Uncharacterized protein n=1 Tax=Hapsidospora chrysogenum (strain ATCC 11550 / CBS 779.69 / DSM 880 / IAM 14645 / JCM 23072 / IMI 49137) TaxID=857340 RepID=A0A086SVW2_HAPC1|nr:hypothetical protein ACRE_080510 [Hapsidospora chrysogenum ATCC 11550]
MHGKGSSRWRRACASAPVHAPLEPSPPPTPNHPRSVVRRRPHRPFGLERAATLVHWTIAIPSGQAPTGLAPVQDD